MKRFIGRLMLCLLLFSGVAVATYSATGDGIAAVQTAGVVGVALADRNKDTLVESLCVYKETLIKGE